MDLRPQETDEPAHHIDKVVEIEPAIKQRDVSRIYPVGDVDIVVGQQGRDGAAQQRREMTRERRHHEYRRLVPGFILAKMEDLAERMRGNDLFGPADLLAADL